ncbi:MAG: ATP-binding protein [Rhodothermaceae bacterium]
MSKKNRGKYYPVFISLVSLAVFITVIFSYTKYYHNNKEKSIRADLHNVLIRKKSQLEKSLNARIYYTKGIAAYTSINPEITRSEFNKLADELINKDSVISTMAIAKDGIINSIYPEKGHLRAIGLNLLDHPERKKIVDTTIATHNTFVAGPLELVEGGIAFVSYTPIFVRNPGFEEKFWGVTDIVIWKDKLFSEVDLTPEDECYKYSLRGIDGSGEDGEIFFGEREIFEQNPVKVDVLLPTGKWILAGIPENGWEKYVNKTEVLEIILYVAAFLFSFLIWLLARAMLKIQNHEKELKTLFGSMDDLIFEFNREYEYVKIAPTNDRLLIQPREKVLGKKIIDFFDKENAKIYMSAIKKCFDTKETITVDYGLTINDRFYWFEGRVTYVNEDSVIFLAHDNTPKKMSQDKLEKSELKLRQLNESKDKLFSIIAHDLRNPFNTTLGLTEILKEDISTLSNEEIKEMLSYIESALKGQLKLLENLLNWAQLQTNHIQLEKTPVNLKILTDEVLEVLDYNLKSKKIEAISELDKQTIVNADLVMLKSVIQNLITNSIKFTRSGGKVNISAKELESDMEIIVSDTGIGMSDKDLGKLFKTDLQHSTTGTLGEKGTGLGLILVKEIIEKHNGTLQVISSRGKGSKFIFTLPGIYKEKKIITNKAKEEE